ncbi:MAG: hypothetical protein HFJ12_06340 [Bacilli bacterium]|nr:hypothetical protein [Bacilli bacterium]
MKKFLVTGFLLIIFGITLLYKEQILKFYYDYFVKETKEVRLGKKNKYYRNYDFLYVQNTNNFKPKNKQELLNIFYTILNAGKDKFTFYCPEEYNSCLDDVKSLAKDQITLSHINNYVHPFNSFKNISTQTDTLGTITVNVKKAYSDTDIRLIEEAIKNIEKEVLDPNLPTEDQIRKIHDYIIDNSKYDSNRTDNNIIEYKSDIAYGPLIEGYGICGGYSDAMELFLDRLNIKSYKVSSEAHVWNAVNLYDAWYHLDLTWDDPVTDTGTDLLEDKFFLISTAQLQQLEKTQHNFDLNAYKEFA